MINTKLPANSLNIEKIINETALDSERPIFSPAMSKSMASQDVSRQRVHLGIISSIPVRMKAHIMILCSHFNIGSSIVTSARSIPQAAKHSNSKTTKSIFNELILPNVKR